MPASSTRREKCRLLKPPRLGYLLLAAERTHTVSYSNWYLLIWLSIYPSVCVCEYIYPSTPSTSRMSVCKWGQPSICNIHISNSAETPRNICI